MNCALCSKRIFWFQKKECVFMDFNLLNRENDSDWTHIKCLDGNEIKVDCRKHRKDEEVGK